MKRDAPRPSSRSRPVAILRSREGVVARGYIGEADLARLRSGAAGRFVPEDPSRPSVPVVLRRVAADAARSLELPELAAPHGGPIAVRPDAGGRLEPGAPVFEALFETLGDPATPNQSVRGAIVVDAARTSLAAMAWRRVSRVIVRESAL